MNFSSIYIHHSKKTLTKLHLQLRKNGHSDTGSNIFVTRHMTGSGVTTMYLQIGNHVITVLK